jgi:hypothetical protein
MDDPCKKTLPGILDMDEVGTVRNKHSNSMTDAVTFSHAGCLNAHCLFLVFFSFRQAVSTMVDMDVAVSDTDARPTTDLPSTMDVSHTRTNDQNNSRLV